MNQHSKPLRVLSLDGGGMRGTYTATYLDRVANAFATRRGVKALDIGAAFDLIVGTSTGGIVACALAAGVPLSDITALYVEQGPKIFTRPVPTGFFSTITDIRKRPQALAEGTEVLRQALERRLGKITLGEIYAARN
ncbi:MAG: patatin-like phospholipase family protein, partial [Methylotetracoccus sp.]|nr:patatin-like phospholipase family protein [Methylotetracoccus sp.]